MSTTAVVAVAPITRRVRAYFAPVNRATQAPSIFDAAQTGTFVLDTPPAPWIDLGWCTKFARRNGVGTKSGVVALRTGAPAMTTCQVRSEVEATVQLEFESWGKLQMALASGSQQMNLLYPAAGATANGSGGTAAAAVPLSAGSTATSLNVGTAAAGFSVGDLVSVDMDYTGQTGFVGSGVSAAYVTASANVASDVNYIRRVSLNVGRVVAITNGALTLAAPLPAGTPSTGMQVSRLLGFVDREGGTFFQEWSGLFVMDGEQGDRMIFHYPRLQTMQGAAEIAEPLAAPLERVRLSGAFRALPVKDANDGEMVLCFRSYLPAAMRTV
ncbi:hypothetical protein [Edaphobacter bradus]|uniref:hypothetical protein n=1 Tax=Edaphobacter bradus TaxID=2259016 RepID=UPI0021DFE848|nr:hypothetical protein [Edaphobacter bradus]